tara:strand:+ start:119 stop:295 length:177 start_codon:yes stop_codon:yes gene_type:complete
MKLQKALDAAYAEMNQAWADWSYPYDLVGEGYDDWRRAYEKWNDAYDAVLKYERGLEQ